MSQITNNNLKIGLDNPPFIIAEMSGNHNQSLDRALEIVEAAASTGAHALKLQTYTADTLTLDINKGEFFISDENSLWKGQSLYELFKQAYTPWEWHKPIMLKAKELGMLCFSSPFDNSAVNFLEDLNVPAYKVASFEATDLPLIKYIASTKKPLIMSTGMANFEEIEEMVDTARGAGCKDLILLHCISSYPAPIDQSNLLTIPDMRKRLGVQIGLSDHSITNTASVVACALGATLIEKHFILDRKESGPDSEFSIEPDDLTNLCKETKDAWLALGVPSYDSKSAEESSIKLRRSVYFVKDIGAGEIITKEHIRRIRPGYGLQPKYEQVIIGRIVNRDVKSGTATKWELISE